jgi:hypothetical protein
MSIRPLTHERSQSRMSSDRSLDILLYDRLGSLHKPIDQRRQPVMRTPSRPSFTISRRVAVAGLGASGLGAALTGRGASAHDDATNLATHPAVGLWTNLVGPDTPPGLRAFNAIHGDGTISGMHSFGGPAAGAWRATGERSIQWLIKYLNIADTPGQYVEGTVTVFSSLTVDEDGTTAQEDAMIEIRDADDTVVGTFPYQSTFTRVPVEAPPAVGTPETATPAP